MFSQFHLESKITENGVKSVPFGTPLGDFLVLWGEISGDRKSVKNWSRNPVSRPCEFCRPGGPPALRTTSPTLQKGGTWTGGTPLRAARARWRIYVMWKIRKCVFLRMYSRLRHAAWPRHACKIQKCMFLKMYSRLRHAA